jgi:thiamine biosynthesis protein ThiS
VSEAPLIQVTVDGIPRRVPAGMSLLALLDQLQEPHGAAVVERNRRFVHKDALATTILQDGDLIEIILPAFGG